MEFSQINKSKKTQKELEIIQECNFESSELCKIVASEIVFATRSSQNVRVSALRKICKNKLISIKSS